MSLAKQYIEGLKNAYKNYNYLKQWEDFEQAISGASREDIEKVLKLYPECPKSLLDLLAFVDGTYYRNYGDTTICFYFLGSNLSGYPYYLLSSAQIINNQKIGENYSDYINRLYEEVDVDDRIIHDGDAIQWLHFSDCMNNGGTSQLFIDFSPSESGTKGQIVRYVHDPDELEVIADSFDAYLEMLIEDEYAFVDEDTIY